MEPTAENTITGPQGAVGAKWAWQGEEVGSGSMEIVEVDPNRAIRYRLSFLSPMEAEAVDSWHFEPTANGTKVTWHDSGELPYPTGRYFGLMLDGVLGEQFETGLANLKARCESLPEAPGVPRMDESTEETSEPAKVPS